MKKKAVLHKNDSILVATSLVKASPYYLFVLILWSVYVVMTLNSPSANNQLHLSSQALSIIRLSVALPYLLIWLVAAYSFVKIYRYSFTIKESKEFEAFKKISLGIFVLLASLAFSTMSSSLRSSLVNYESFRAPLTIITNYLYVIPYLIAFALLFIGVNELSKNHLKLTLKKYFIFSLPLIVLAYAWLEWIFTNQFRATPSEVSKFASYYLSDSVIVLTIVIPSFLAWVFGFMASLKLWEYHKRVKGQIYKGALSSFVYGFIGVIIASILLQALLSLGPTRLLGLGLTNILLLIYLFLLIQGAGFLLIGRGARNLTKIETV